MARPSNSTERRLQIANALRKVMAAKGYEGASIADVAAEAGLATGLVHYHFKSKLEILLAVLDELFEAHLVSLDEALARADGDATMQLATFIDVHLATGEHADPERLACWIALMGEAIREPSVRAPYERATSSIVGRLTRILEGGVASGAFREDPQIAAAALMATIQGYYVLAATARDQIPRRSAAGAVRSMARGLLQLATPLPTTARKRPTRA